MIARQVPHLKRRGITVLEVLVCLAIVAVLLQLLATAVLQAREASRRTTCQARLHQIGIAASCFAERTGRYPISSMTPYGAMNWYGYLLADLGHASLQQDAYLRGNYGPSLQPWWRTHAVRDFQCPSDPGAVHAYKGSYCMNSGCHFAEFQDQELYPEFQYPHGMKYASLRPNNITDGMTNTAFVAERVSILRFPTERRARWTTPHTFESFDSVDPFADLCARMPTSSPEPPDDWWEGEIINYQYYDHIMTPNQPSCLDFEYGNAISTRASSSEHAGGANVLFADGAVHFLSDSIDRAVWRAMGTRAGNDAFSWP